MCFISLGNYDSGWDRILITREGCLSCVIYHHCYLEFFIAGFCLLLPFSYKLQNTEMEVIQLVSFIVAAITKYC